MKSVKISLLIALMLTAWTASSGTVAAQENTQNKESVTQTPERPAAGQRVRRPAANQLERLAEQLKLTEEQKTKLQPIFQEQTAKLRELRQDTALSQEERRTKVRELREQLLAKMKPVLTAEQMEQYKKLRDQPARGPRGAGDRDGTAPRRPRGDRAQ